MSILLICNISGFLTSFETKRNNWFKIELKTKRYLLKKKKKL